MSVAENLRRARERHDQGAGAMSLLDNEDRCCIAGAVLLANGCQREELLNVSSLLTAEDLLREHAGAETDALMRAAGISSGPMLLVETHDNEWVNGDDESGKQWGLDVFDRAIAEAERAQRRTPTATDGPLPHAGSGGVDPGDTEVEIQTQTPPEPS